jgi:hypothetical protein
MASRDSEEETESDDFCVGESDPRVRAIFTFWPRSISREEKNQITQAAINWFTELDKCTAAHREKKMFAPAFQDVRKKNELQRYPNGGLRMKPLSPHPVISFLQAGVLVEEEKARTLMNPGRHRIGTFTSGETSRLATFWCGLIGTKASTRPNKKRVVAHKMLESSPADPFPTPSFRAPTKRYASGADVIQLEKKKRTLKGSLAKLFKALDTKDSIPYVSSNYLALSLKAAGIITCCEKHAEAEGRSVVGDVKVREALLQGFKPKFAKECGPLALAAVIDEKIISGYAKDNVNQEFGDGTKVRQAITKLLETKIAAMNSFTDTHKIVATCFKRCKIKGIKKILNS